MKLTIIGGAGLRTPLIIKAILARQDRLDIHELVLLDIDEERLQLIEALTSSTRKIGGYKISYFTDNRSNHCPKGCRFCNYYIQGWWHRISYDR